MSQIVGKVFNKIEFHNKIIKIKSIKIDDHNVRIAQFEKKITEVHANLLLAIPFKFKLKWDSYFQNNRLKADYSLSSVRHFDQFCSQTLYLST